jgi:hypothetical protein
MRYRFARALSVIERLMPVHYRGLIGHLPK